MTRPVWKGPYCPRALIRPVIKARKLGVLSLKTRCRAAVIIPEFVGMVFYVYNGMKYIPVRVIEDMIGHKLGEFSPTRTYHGHSVGKKVVRK